MNVLSVGLSGVSKSPEAHKRLQTLRDALRFAPLLLKRVMMLACVGLPAVTLCAATTAVAEQDAERSVPEISIWVDDASLALVVDQLAQMSGKSPAIQEGLTGIVSGRFIGTMQDTLTQLGETQKVLFDVDSDTLSVIDLGDSISASIPLDERTLPEDYKSQLAAAVLPGNNVEFREDAVHVSGHPSFVNRTAASVSATLADIGGRQNAELAGKQGDVEQAVAAVTTVADAGVEPMVEDMQDETREPSERTSLTKPIRWVTDIPGYTTF